MSQFATLKFTPIDEQETRKAPAVRLPGGSIIIHAERTLLDEIRTMARLDGMTPEAYLLRLHLRYQHEMRGAQV